MANKNHLIYTKALTQEEFKILAEVSQDPFAFANYIYLRNPVRGRCKFELYPYQRKVLWYFLTNRFNIILKFRQAGITELISLYCLWLAMYHPDKNIVILSLKERVAKKVLGKIKYMYRNLPDFLKTSITNGRTGELGTSTEMEFSNGSTIASIPTTEDAGRSEGLSLLVIDEAAIMKWAGLIWAAAFPTLSTGGSAIVNSCVTGDTNIMTKDGPLRIDTICPKEFGRQTISHLGIEVLSHKGKWRRVLGSVNKGLLPTWEIRNDKGQTLKCTPDHKLLTAQGWKPVKEIVEKGLEAIFYDFGEQENKVTLPPLKEEFKPVKGYPNYEISNLGRLFIVKDGKRVEKKCSPNKWGYRTVRLWHKGESKKIQINRLVAKTFIGKIPKGYVVDHLNTVRTDDYVTNLEIVTVQENSKRGAKYSTAHSIGAARSHGGFANLQVIAYIRQKYAEYKGKVDNFQDKIIAEIMDLYGVEVNRSYLTKVASGKRSKNTYTSKLEVVRKYMDYIYDISVEEDQSYFTDTQYVNHNTPYGVGNWYHKQWVDACSGGNGFFPIRLKWQMHPERGIEWYEEQAAALGPRRTAQEIDGDFLTSGASVFDLADIRALEEEFDIWLDVNENPDFKVYMNGQFLQFKKPKPNERYFIGSDVSSGRSRDYSAFSIMNAKGEEFGAFKGKLHPKRLATTLMEWGKTYNKALLAPEGNDIGLTTVSEIDDSGYPNLYYARTLLRKKGQKRGKEKDVPGWYTTKENRPNIISGLEEDIRLGTTIIKDPRFTEEAYTFIYNEQNKAIAMGKGTTKDDDDEDTTYTDDAIMGKAITNHIRKGAYRSGVYVPPAK